MPELQNLESLYPAESREKEIGELLTFIKNGKSAQLIGLPGTGRGNALGFLAYNRTVRIHHLGEEGQLAYHFVLCNLSEVKKRPLFDVMKFLFLELSSSLHERKRDEEFGVVDKLFKDALSYQDELVLFQEFKKAIDYLTLERDITVVLLLDRFESFVPDVTDAFFTNLRSIRNRAKYKFSVIFSSTRPLEEMIENTLFADFYEYVVGNMVYLSLLDMVGLSFRIAYLEKLTGKKLSDTTKQAILDLTAGHGKLTRLALEYVFSKDPSGKVTEKELLAQKTIRGALEEIWQFLTPDEQQDMVTICNGKECPLPCTFLQDCGLIKNNTITIPLFARFVAEKKEEKKEEPFLFDSQSNTIRRGTTVVSDQLTKSEFRLLQLLLTNPNEIFDREKIINAVWTDNKTQAGVSEQAIDQLVFRLRKKIEDDPNSPTHILTVKGRGVRFVQ